MGKRAAISGVICVFLPLMNGCKALAVATTAVRPDGTWSRTIRFRGGTDLADLKKIFVLPYGAGWNTRKEWREHEAAYLARREARAGDTVRDDLRVRMVESGAQLLWNEVTVRLVAPGRLEYREVLRWRGPRPEIAGGSKGEMLAELRKAMPDGLATDENLCDLSGDVLRQMTRIWFGPGTPLFLNGHDDLADRRFRRLLGHSVEQALQRKLGDRLNPAQRLATTRRWVQIITQMSEKERSLENSSDPSGNTEATIAPLLFSVWLPGKVVATNGERDEISGEVYWGLYPEAASLEDVVLTATCDLSPANEKPATISRQR